MRSFAKEQYSLSRVYPVEISPGLNYDYYLECSLEFLGSGFLYGFRVLQRLKVKTTTPRNRRSNTKNSHARLWQERQTMYFGATILCGKTQEVRPDFLFFKGTEIWKPKEGKHPQTMVCTTFQRHRRQGHVAAAGPGTFACTQVRSTRIYSRSSAKQLSRPKWTLWLFAWLSHPTCDVWNRSQQARHLVWQNFRPILTSSTSGLTNPSGFARQSIIRIRVPTFVVLSKVNEGLGNSGLKGGLCSCLYYGCVSWHYAGSSVSKKLRSCCLFKQITHRRSKKGYWQPVFQQNLLEEDRAWMKAQDNIIYIYIHIHIIIQYLLDIEKWLDGLWGVYPSACVSCSEITTKNWETQEALCGLRLPSTLVSWCGENPLLSCDF